MPGHRPHAPSADDLRRILHGLTAVLILVAIGCLVFTATTVTGFALHHGVSRHIAWMLDPLLGVALGTVLITDGLLAEYQVRPGGWATVLRWFAGIATWLLNCWDSIWPYGTPFGIPYQLDPAGLALHSVLPVLLVILAEAITRYRREIVARLRELEKPVPEPAAPPAPTPAPARPVPVPRPVAPRRPRSTICGAQRVFTPAVPRAVRPVPMPQPQPDPRPEPQPEPDPQPAVRLDAEQARVAIEEGWRAGLTIRDCATKATRSASFVHRVYQELEAQFGPQPSAGQLALAGAS